MHTNHDAIDYIALAIGGAGPDVAKPSEYDLDAIARDIHATTGSWDMSAVDHDVFWAAVERDAKPTLVAKVVLDTDMDAYRVDVMVDNPDVHDVREVHAVESGEEEDAWIIARTLATRFGYRLAEPNEA